MVKTIKINCFPYFVAKPMSSTSSSAFEAAKILTQPNPTKAI